jgi:hypothetical protein
MVVVIVICSLVLAAIVVMLISAPLRAGSPAASSAGGEGSAAEASATGGRRRADLESAREAKYREIRDAELDYRTGKLSEADFNSIDAQLRAEALGILNELEALGEPAGDADTPG